MCLAMVRVTLTVTAVKTANLSISHAGAAFSLPSLPSAPPFLPPPGGPSPGGMPGLGGMGGLNAQQVGCSHTRGHHSAAAVQRLCSALWFCGDVLACSRVCSVSEPAEVVQHAPLLPSQHWVTAAAQPCNDRTDSELQAAAAAAAAPFFSQQGFNLASLLPPGAMAQLAATSSGLHNKRVQH
jgi:hypothetical protein